MLPIADLNFGFSDAENYKRRENKDLFNQLFVRDEALERLMDRGTFFLIGEKGTGKTAHAVYLENNRDQSTTARLLYIRETEYAKFVTLKKERHLVLSDYANIWKVIIYLLFAETISRKNTGVIDRLFRLRNIKKAIDEYYASAFSPELIYAMNFVEESKVAAELISKHVKAGAEEKVGISFAESKFQTNLLYIQRMFEEALGSLKLDDNYLLFLDGIDIRPESIPYEDYLDCVKGLANAIWSLNNEFFANIRDSRGRLRVVLLIRPDIFESLGLQNKNTKVRDNEVFLRFFTYLGSGSGNRFTYDQFLHAYAELGRFLSENKKVSPAFLTSADELLQFSI